jgi:hypothetical protein
VQVVARLTGAALGDELGAGQDVAGQDRPAGVRLQTDVAVLGQLVPQVVRDLPAGGRLYAAAVGVADGALSWGQYAVVNVQVQTIADYLSFTISASACSGSGSGAAEATMVARAVSQPAAPTLSQASSRSYSHQLLR